MKSLRILTFNHHEAYLCSLAETGHDFDVVTRYKSLDLSWNESSHPVPDNIRLIPFDDDLKRRLHNNEYDIVVCHTIKNLLWLFSFWNCRFIFVAHIPLFRYKPMLLIKSLAKKAVWKLFKLSHFARFVAVSEFKRSSWHEQGDVVVLSPKYLGPLTGDGGYQSIAVVCNDLATRREELGLPLIRSLQKSFAISVIGKNPGIDGAVQPANFDEFKSCFNSHRIYLYTIKQPYGDGYNTAMLEAMRMGMAIVTVENPSSPIIHGENGLVFCDADQASDCLRALLGNKELVDRLGRNAQKYVEDYFSSRLFLQGWQAALDNAAFSGSRKRNY